MSMFVSVVLVMVVRATIRADAASGVADVTLDSFGTLQLSG